MAVTDKIDDHRAPAGKYRVIVCESQICETLIGDFAEEDAAIRAAKDELVPMLSVYVYDDQGRCMFHDHQVSEF